MVVKNAIVRILEKCGFNVRDITKPYKSSSCFQPMPVLGSGSLLDWRSSSARICRSDSCHRRHTGIGGCWNHRTRRRFYSDSRHRRHTVWIILLISLSFFRIMENSIDCVILLSNRQELSVLERAQDVANISTSPDRELGTKYLLIILILCIH